MNLLLALLVIALIPLLLIYVLAMLEPFAFVRWRMVGVSLVWGAVSYLLARIIQGYERDSLQTTALGLTLLAAPLLEELFKMVFPVVVYERRWAYYSGDGLVYGFAVGSGFAIVENIAYLAAQPDPSLGFALTRILTTGFFHASLAAIVGAAVCGMLYYRRWIAYPFFAAIYLFAVIAHHWFNLNAYVAVILGDYLDSVVADLVLDGLLWLSIVFGLSFLIKFIEWRRIPRVAANVLSPVERMAVRQRGQVQHALERQGAALGAGQTQLLQRYLRAEAQIALLVHRASATGRLRRDKTWLLQDVANRRAQAGQLEAEMTGEARTWLAEETA